MSWLDVDNVALEILGYPLSWVELIGTLLYLASVLLVIQRRVLTWPVGIVSVLLYAALFWQVRLYADAAEQVYYVGVSLYGWIHWSRQPSATRIDVGWSSTRTALQWLGATAVASAAFGWILTRAHIWGPALFPEPAAYPFVDAATTVASFVAMWLMARRKVESWLYWIAVDVVAVWLYTVKDVRFVALLYVLLLALAINGLRSWRLAQTAVERALGGS